MVMFNSFGISINLLTVRKLFFRNIRSHNSPGNYHASFRFTFEYQEIEGNYEPLADYASLEAVTLGYSDDGTQVTATFTPLASNKVYRVSSFTFLLDRIFKK